MACMLFRALLPCATDVNFDCYSRIHDDGYHCILIVPLSIPSAKSLTTFWAAYSQAYVEKAALSIIPG